MEGDGSPQLKSPLIESGSVGHNPDTTEVPAAGTRSTDIVINVVDGGHKKTLRKLKYQDFYPRKTIGPSGETAYAAFGSLIDKANDWLRKHLEWEVKGCESIMRITADIARLERDDEAVTSKSVNANPSSHDLKGLRLWLVPNQKRVSDQISYIDYVPCRNDTMPKMVEKANRTIDQGSYQGSIVTIESVYAPMVNGNPDAECSYWKESAYEFTNYAFVLRIFYSKAQHSMPTIGLQDFVPLPVEDGYEGFDQMIGRANQWILDKGDIHVTNMQSVMIQKDDGPHSELGSSCYFSTPGLKMDCNYELMRILRVGYTKSSTGSTTPPPASLIHPFSYESFTPELLMDGTKGKRRIESLSATFAAVSTFLENTDVDVICAETVANPMQITDSASEDSEDLIKWLYSFRLYVTGQICEVDGGKPIVPKRGSTIRKSVRKPSADHPGPIFLRRVVNQRSKYRMVVAALTIFVAVCIIVVVSIVYSNQGSS